MSDIFEIKGVDASVKIKGVVYKFADPRFKDKVLLRKKLKELESKKDSFSEEDYAIAAYDISKQMIKQYVPEIPKDVLEALGDYETMAMLEHLQKMAEVKFNATVSVSPEGK